MTLLRILHDFQSSLRDAGPASFFPRPRGHEITLIQRFRTVPAAFFPPPPHHHAQWTSVVSPWLDFLDDLARARGESFIHLPRVRRRGRRKPGRGRGSSSTVAPRNYLDECTCFPVPPRVGRLFCLAPTHFFFSFFSSLDQALNRAGCNQSSIVKLRARTRGHG